jgi:enterochelin esterase-like enzyme
MKAERMLAVATKALLVLIALGGCAKPAPDLSYGPGEIKQYQVPAGKLKMNLSVYLPGKYSESGLRYPVLYLLHGDGGNDRTFFGGGYIEFGRAMSDANVALIIDKLLQERKTKPLIVACPALATEEDVLSFFVPFVDATFRTFSRKESRAIAGHSTGGFKALHLSLAHPQAFGVCGGLSSFGLSSILAEYQYSTQDLKSNPVLYWLYAGTKDQEALASSSKDTVNLLRERGLSATYVEDDGDHINRAAARLAQFVEYLSKRLKWGD